MIRWAVVLFCLTPLFAAEDPVQWNLSFEHPTVAPGAHALTHLEAKLEPGWHLYSITTPKGGPIPTKIPFAESAAIAHTVLYQPKPERRFDANFQLDVETFTNDVVFVVDVEVAKSAAAGPLELTAKPRYQACNDKMCLPPKSKAVAGTLTIDPAALPTAVNIPSGYFPAVPVSTTPIRNSPAQSSDSIGAFLLIAFGAGLASIFTPCVFPMIPFTVSYFLKRQSTTSGQGIAQAAVFCGGIVVLFTSLGLLTKAIAGPFGVVQLGSSPWVNGFITIVFIVFALSLLGAYELTLPSGILTRMNQASDRGGYAGTLLMGLTFSLTSFACVGPIVGPLLVASVQQNGFQPVLGMICFAAGLAAPFFFLALFPSYMQRMPKSGGWLMRVKVVLGFVVLAASLKYLSNIDQVLQTNLITREIFIAAWIILFALPGLYLLGFLRLEGVHTDEQVGVPRTLIAAAFLAFSVSLLPGLFGRPIAGLDAYIPASSNSGYNTTSGEAETPWLKNQYAEALTRARQENKLVLINFTGYACTNCHWMKANMFPRPEIRPLLKNFVLVDLYTDGTDNASEQNQQLEEKKFKTVAIPFYAILDPDEKVIATFPGLTKSSTEFTAFLKTGAA